MRERRDKLTLREALMNMRNKYPKTRGLFSLPLCRDRCSRASFRTKLSATIGSFLGKLNTPSGVIVCSQQLTAHAETCNLTRSSTNRSTLVDWCDWGCSFPMACLDSGDMGFSWSRVWGSVAHVFRLLRVPFVYAAVEAMGMSDDVRGAGGRWEMSRFIVVEEVFDEYIYTNGSEKLSDSLYPSILDSIAS